MRGFATNKVGLRLCILASIMEIAERRVVGRRNLHRPTPDFFSIPSIREPVRVKLETDKGIRYAYISVGVAKLTPTFLHSK
jgi:hypothetical protein